MLHCPVIISVLSLAVTRTTLLCFAEHVVLENWFRRHQNRCSVRLHAVGIPLAIAAIPLVIVGIVRDRGWFYVLAAAALVIGYVLQFIGHAIEGNDVGEVILIKKLLGRPYKAIADPPEKETGHERSE